MDLETGRRLIAEQRRKHEAEWKDASIAEIPAEWLTEGIPISSTGDWGIIKYIFTRKISAVTLGHRRMAARNRSTVLQPIYRDEEGRETIFQVYHIRANLDDLVEVSTGIYEIKEDEPTHMPSPGLG